MSSLSCPDISDQNIMLIANQVSSKDTSPTIVRFLVILELKLTLLVTVALLLFTDFVPHMSYRHNIISCFAKLLPESFDVHINSAALTLKVISPDLAEKLFS